MGTLLDSAEQPVGRAGEASAGCCLEPGSASSQEYRNPHRHKMGTRQAQWVTLCLMPHFPGLRAQYLAQHLAPAGNERANEYRGFLKGEDSSFPLRPHSWDPRPGSQLDTKGAHSLFTAGHKVPHCCRFLFVLLSRSLTTHTQGLTM